ncbi:tetratricopeptide repeat protein 12-like isoform X1 [Vespa mandarinia]|uniref:tetratricopeptide repeat protein 12-like isoform X1 n=1 Tax=Vespa mandarinia TaxID=7446 RepID=UPI0016202B2D|nr:tetratricopeptide repeat protein 12-like isoform X1 [Vespa mandarinia]
MDSKEVEYNNEHIIEREQAIENLSSTNKLTEEEFQNFMHRVTEIEKIVSKLLSSDPKEQELGETLADKILNGKIQKEFSELEELKVKTNRTIINKCSINENTSDPNKMGQEAFMKSIEKDANERAADRKIRNERAETLKRIGNGAFKEGDYEKAVTYFTKAIEQRKDSTVLWNNRALSYMNLKLFEKALHDCEWALKVSDSNLKALLNSAKCYKNLRNEGKCKEFIKLAREKNPHFQEFIDDFEKDLDTIGDE